ncbi:MAG: PEP-CTERM sorting domain-containing protein [Verrucomicrobiota bacterium JB022]|nr:PEP-CTERM sorting domain-containing protein [Verrucomicrobiota bacterium JB022]
MTKYSLLLLASLPVGLFGSTIFDDSFSDGLAAATGPSDTNWYKSTSSQSYEEATGYLGLVSGSSGRGIHTVFGSQSLNVGDSLRASFTFNTPDTVGTDRTGSFRFGFFNSNGMSAAQDYTSSTDAAWDPVRGYMAAMDVNVLDGSDTGIFKRQDPSGTGANNRLLGTTSFYDTLGTGGSDFSMVDNATYTGTFSITRLDATTLQFTAVLSILGGGEITSFSVEDDAATTMAFDMFGLHVNSATFGTSNAAGEADNGLDFTNVMVTYVPGAVVPEPSTYAALTALVALGFVACRRRRA